MTAAIANDVARRSELEALRDELKALREEFARFREQTAEAIEDAECSAILYAYRNGPPQETFPSSMLDRLIAGDPPIVVYREHRGMTQAELAKAAGTTPSYVSQIETGHRDAGKTLRKRLAEALGVDEEDLL